MSCRARDQARYGFPCDTRPALETGTGHPGPETKHLKMLESSIDRLFTKNPESYDHRDMELFQEFKDALNAGTVRAAEPDAAEPTGWKVNAWVKRGILVGFRMGKSVDMTTPGSRFPYIDKSTYPPRKVTVQDSVRIVPGGSSIRDGCYIGKSVTCMPPMYINVGAYVDEGTMVDSHALVGSCAQVGKNCHLSAAAQIGGVLEPVGALPVIIEDNVLVGGNCGVYEGTVVKKRAVLGAGVILTRSTPVYDIVNETVYKATDDQPLVIPEGAVVVAGSRPIAKGAGKKWDLSLYTPVIVKYRDEKTDQRIQLEEFLR
jgi:2,3,4,5-tetrahydropyridine-2,6-dicarboxylate N-succinyltransferase